METTDFFVLQKRIKKMLDNSEKILNAGTVPRCAACTHLTVSRWSKARRARAFCEHPDKSYIQSFCLAHGQDCHLLGFIGFTRELSTVPQISTSPRWCPLRKRS